MSVVKECRCCRKPLYFPPGCAVLECDACDTLNERPVVEGIMLDHFRRAICQQADGDFYNAEKSYQLVLNSCPDNAEALWNRLLCHYGAVYVNESGKRLWEMHATRTRPLSEQGDFRRACQLAVPDVRMQYEADAAYIDSTMARIRQRAEKCPPYDVFLCHKTRDENDGYTEDYNRAYALYNLLTKRGYRVFFAPVEMESVSAGEDYEAAIYHALETARVMLVICSDPQYLTSLWVQSEWKRYLEKIDGGQDKHLIPLLYGGLKAELLPQEFRSRRLQAVVMELDATEKVLSAVGQYVRPKRGVAKRPPWLLPVLMAGLLLAGGALYAYEMKQQGAWPPEWWNRLFTAEVAEGVEQASDAAPTETPAAAVQPSSAQEELTILPAAREQEEATASGTVPGSPALPEAAAATVPGAAAEPVTPKPAGHTTPQPTEELYPVGRVCVVWVASGHVRSGPGTEYPDVGDVLEGEKYLVHARELGSSGKDWYQIDVGGRRCWISSTLVRVGGHTHGTVNGVPID